MVRVTVTRKTSARGAAKAEGPIMVHATAIESPIGRLTVAVRDEGIVWIGMDTDPDEDGPNQRPARFVHEVERRVRGVRWVWEDVPDQTAPVVDALRRYFEGDADAFKGLPIAPVGTEFQMAVWEACARIPFGKTSSYGQLALAAGHMGAARAVGGAMNRNPVPLVVPCHRVLGADGDLVGYGMGGTGVKKWLLAHESRTRQR